MKKNLVLAEKPSVGRDIAKVLKCTKNKKTYIEGDKYIVTWALGHLVGLQDPEMYDEKYKNWNLETLPMLPKFMKTMVLKKTSKQFYEVKKLLNRDDIENIIIATDAGREGELVARWIILKSGCKKPIKRLWISSQTDKAILNGFKNLKDGKEYDNLFKAAECRAEADWIVGLNVTRGLTVKYNTQLSAGRVQSPTLSLIVNRENEIENFKPKKYNTINVKSNKCDFTWVNKENNSRIFDLDFSKKIKDKLNNNDIKIININNKIKKVYPKPLYDLTELQRDCNKLWGFSPKQTLNIMQRLYENYKILTYPRTDSRYITTDIVSTLKDRINAVSVGEYRSICQGILKTEIKGNKSFVDNSKVSDHHAIIPTEEKVNLSILNLDERKVHDLVVKRFLSHFVQPYIYVETVIEAECNNQKLIAKGKILKEIGWKKLYDEKDNEENLINKNLSSINKNDVLKVEFVEIKENLTEPPSRFTEASLLSAMENPQKFINVDKNFAKTLNETGGLGTVATRADIIEKLFNTFVIEKKDKYIYPTSKGKQLIDLVPKDLKSPLLTAEWEQRLDSISKGRENPNKFLKEIRNYVVKLVCDIKSSELKFKHDNISRKKCPECGKYMLEVKSKQGKMYVCQDRECGHRENISKITNARCPECKKRLELRGSGNSKFYVCTGVNCNFREKESVFKKRFNKSDKVNKREVNKIMKKMQNEANKDINNPFADLLKDFK